MFTVTRLIHLAHPLTHSLLFLVWMSEQCKKLAEYERDHKSAPSLIKSIHAQPFSILDLHNYISMIGFARTVNRRYKRKALDFDTAYVSLWLRECPAELLRAPEPLQNVFRGALITFGHNKVSMKAAEQTNEHLSICFYFLPDLPCSTILISSSKGI